MSVCLYVFLLLLFHVLCLSLYLFPFTFTRCQVKKCITLLFFSPFFPWLPPSFLFLSFLSLVPSFLLNSHFFPSFFSSFPWFPPSFLFLLFSFPGSLLPSFQTLTSLLPSLFRLFTNITSSIFLFRVFTYHRFYTSPFLSPFLTLSSHFLFLPPFLAVAHVWQPWRCWFYGNDRSSLFLSVRRVILFPFDYHFHCNFFRNSCSINVVSSYVILTFSSISSFCQVRISFVALFFLPYCLHLLHFPLFSFVLFFSCF